MKKKIIITVSVFLVIITGITVAGAARFGGHRNAEHRIDYVRMKLTETLELNDTQKAALDGMTEEILAKINEMHAGRDEFKSRMFQVLNQDQVTAEELEALFAEKKPYYEQMVQLAARNIAEFHGMLTPEQRTRLIEEMKNLKRGCRFGK